MPRFQWRVLYQDLDNLGLQVWTFTCTLLVTFLYYCGISKDSLRVPLSIRERISKPHPGAGAAPPTARHTHSALATHRSMRPVGQARPLLPHFTLAQHWPHTEVCVLAQLQNCSKTTATVPCDSWALGCS